MAHRKCSRCSNRVVGVAHGGGRKDRGRGTHAEKKKQWVWQKVLALGAGHIKMGNEHTPPYQYPSHRPDREVPTMGEGKWHDDIKINKLVISYCAHIGKDLSLLITQWSPSTIGTLS